MKDIIKGGVSDKLTLLDIAKKHKVSLEVIKTQFKMGIKIELEHTDDLKIAAEIAKDHLTEDPKYYSKLKSMEKSK